MNRLFALDDTASRGRKVIWPLINETAWGRGRGPLLVLCATFALLLVSGCTRRVTVAVPDIRLSESPLVQKLPLTVGVRYAPGFSDYRYVTRLPQHPLAEITIELGNVSTSMFGQALGALFDDVVRLEDQSRPPAPLDAILDIEFGIVRLVSLDGPRLLEPRELTVSVAYVIRLEAQNDRYVVDTWSVSATRSRPGGIGVESSVSPATQEAVRSAVAQFLVDFSASPAVRKWLEARRGPSTGAGAER